MHTAIVTSSAAAIFLFLISVLTPFDAAQAQTIELHKPSDKPIHIGDGRGKFDDIPSKDQSFVPSTKKSWSFNVTAVPATAHANVHMYSLSGKNEYDCPTILSLNGKEIHNLATGDNVGSGKDTKSVVAMPPTLLRTGANEIAITEKECRGGGINDSLIRSVTVDLR